MNSGDCWEVLTGETLDEGRRKKSVRVTWPPRLRPWGSCSGTTSASAPSSCCSRPSSRGSPPARTCPWRSWREGKLVKLAANSDYHCTDFCKVTISSSTVERFTTSNDSLDLPVSWCSSLSKSKASLVSRVNCVNFFSSVSGRIWSWMGKCWKNWISAPALSFPNLSPKNPPPKFSVGNRQSDKLDASRHIDVYILLYICVTDIQLKRCSASFCSYPHPLTPLPLPLFL